MSKKMLINASHPEENRVAIVVDGLLSELDIEIAGQEQTKGNIYKAVVVRVESGLQAAFVDYGAEKLGFLQIGEIHPNLYPAKDETKNRPRITDILQRGQEILVQIVKEERGNKGAALTTNLSVPGRYMVLMPDSTTKGVSRKIQDDQERKKLKKTMAELNLPERMGYIVRTAGIGKEKEELKRDFDYLVRLFEGIVTRKDQVKAPAQLYRESNLVIRSIRDYFSTDMDEVLIDDPKVYQETKDFFALVMPELTHLVKQHRERRPVFSRYQIEEQIDGLAKNQIPLPSGGSIVIDQTEALVAIDVNSGKMSSESGIEATASKTNIEAAAEVGRQLRLRDLGGLVVIDFIDMRDRKHIRAVEQELRKSLKEDKAKVSVGRISQFGLMEMSRQRLKPTLSVGSYLECPHCQGKGRIKSAENQAVALLRQIHAAASKGHIGHIEANVPLDVANDLLNSKRQSLVELEKRLNLKVSIIGHPNMTTDQLNVVLHKREKTGEDSRDIAPVSHANQIENALAAAQQTESIGQTDETALDNSEVPGATAVTGQEGEEEPTKKKSRRRRKRRRKTDRPAEATQVAQSEATEETPSETINQTAAESAPTTENLSTDMEQKAVTAVAPETTQAPPKKRRPRRTTTKKPTDATALPAENTTVPEIKSGVEETASAVQTEEKPKRRPRRTSKKAAAEAPAEATVEATTVETVQEEKPKRRPRRTTKKSPSDVPAETDATQVESPTEEKPKRRTRQATKKTTDEAAAAAGDAPTSVTTEVPAEEKPKRRTRRATKKAPAEVAAETTAAAVETTADEKPKRRPGRPRKQPAAKTTTETAAASDKLTAEKPKRRPGRPRKTVSPEQNEE